MDNRVRYTGIGIAIAALVTHLSGALRAVEEEHGMTTIASASFHWFNNAKALSTPQSEAAAKSVIVEFSKGSDAERIATRAFCATVGSFAGSSPDHQRLVAAMDAQVDPQFRGNRAVKAAEDKLASRIQSAMPSGRFYLLDAEACK